MPDSAAPKPLNIVRRQSTTEEFITFYDKEKERQMSSGEDFNEATFTAAGELILAKLGKLEDEGWV